MDVTKILRMPKEEKELKEREKYDKALEDHLNNMSFETKANLFNNPVN